MIDPAKTYRTRDGREVRIYAVDGVGDWPVHGAIKEERGWKEETWTLEGQSLTPLPRNEDLIESKRKRVMWINVYDSMTANGHESLEEANSRASLDRIACVRVEFEEGEGL